MRHMLTDDSWAAFGPLAERAKRRNGGHPPGTPGRRFFEAVLYWARTGIPWRHLPAEFGEWGAVSNRLRRRVYSGGPAAPFDLPTAAPELGAVRRVLIDSTTVRAHQHGAGAGRRKERSGRPGRRPTRVSAGAAAGRPPR